jgi:hypothetical protein
VIETLKIGAVHAEPLGYRQTVEYPLTADIAHRRIECRL